MAEERAGEKEQLTRVRQSSWETRGWWGKTLEGKAAAQRVVVVQLLSRVQLFATPWTAACQASLSFTISWSLLRFMFIELVTPSNHLILSLPLLLCLQFFPASGCFPMSWTVTSGGQSIGASASAAVLSVNIQDWFPLEFTGWSCSLSTRDC